MHDIAPEIFDLATQVVTDNFPLSARPSFAERRQFIDLVYRLSRQLETVASAFVECRLTDRPVRTRPVLTVIEGGRHDRQSNSMEPNAR